MFTSSAHDTPFSEKALVSFKTYYIFHMTRNISWYAWRHSREFHILTIIVSKCFYVFDTLLIRLLLPIRNTNLHFGTYCLRILLLWSLSRSKILPQGFDTKSKKRYWGSMWDCPTILHSRISQVPPHKTLDGEAPILIGRRSLFPCSYKQWHFWNGDASSVRPILENRVSPNTQDPDDWLLGIGPKPCSMDW